MSDEIKTPLEHIDWWLGLRDRDIDVLGAKNFARAVRKDVVALAAECDALKDKIERVRELVDNDKATPTHPVPFSRDDLKNRIRGILGDAVLPLQNAPVVSGELTEKRLDVIIAREFQRFGDPGEHAAQRGAERLKRELIRLGFAAPLQNDTTKGTVCKFKIGDMVRYEAWGGFDMPTVTVEQTVDAIRVFKGFGIEYEFHQGDGLIRIVSESDCELVSLTAAPSHDTREKE
jgi:hypothetical protein